MMDPFEIKDTLATFRILADTREQNTPRAQERFEAFGVPVERATLNYGDYAGQINLLDGSALYDPSGTVSAQTVIERKMSLDELAMCFTRGRDRFRREFERAASAQASTWLLIEGGSWEAIDKHRYRSKFSEKAMRASLIAWSVRYGFKIVFCRPETSGALIREILYRDIKERLERGEYG